MHPLISVWFLKISETMGDQCFVFVFVFEVPSLRLVQTSVSAPLPSAPTMGCLFLPEPKAASHSVLPGPVEPCFILGHFYFF